MGILIKLVNLTQVLKLYTRYLNTNVRIGIKHTIKRIGKIIMDIKVMYRIFKNGVNRFIS